MFNQAWYRRQVARRFNLKYDDARLSGPGRFYRYLVNKHIGKNKIYIEYDEQSLPLREYLEPQGLLFEFRANRFDRKRYVSEDFFKEDIRPLEEYCQTGMDFEELKCMIWVIHNRGLFFKAHGLDGLADKYFKKMDELANYADN